MTTSSFFQKMSDGTEISVNRWIPDENTGIRAIVQLSHGMVEHAVRYDRFGSILAENGFLFSAHDFRGHGKTAQKAEADEEGKFGHLADTDGFNKVTDDIKEITERVKQDYPDKRVFLLGHSFGSFVAQNFIEKYAEDIDGCVLMGTSGPMGFLSHFGKFVSGIECLFCGKRHKSPFLNNLSFGPYNKKIDNPQHEHDWLSRDMKSVEMYEADKWCGFVPTAGFFHDMTGGLCQIHRRANMKRIPQDLPILIVYGTDDPVGKYGKTVKNLAEIYKTNGMKDITIKEYARARHELLNEENKDEVISGLIAWVIQHI